MERAFLFNLPYLYTSVSARCMPIVGSQHVCSPIPLLWYADTLSLFQTWLKCPGPSYLNLLLFPAHCQEGRRFVGWCWSLWHGLRGRVALSPWLEEEVRASCRNINLFYVLQLFRYLSELVPQTHFWLMFIQCFPIIIHKPGAVCLPPSCVMLKWHDNSQTVHYLLIHVLNSTCAYLLSSFVHSSIATYLSVDLQFQ